jgi:hypothetical protein
MDYCPSCGSAVSPGTTFCSQCGARVDNVPASAPAGGYYDPYAAPAYRQSSGVATASLVLGIISVVMSLMSCIPIVSYCTCIAVPIMALIGFIMGIVGLSNPAGKGKATWGIILSIVAVIICVVLVVLYLLGVVGLSILQGSSSSY